MNEIKKNIADTIRRMKRAGTIGASVDCLIQNTPTTGVIVPPAKYRELFESAAAQLASRMRFNLYR
jgi:hypothetical protein